MDKRKEKTYYKIYFAFKELITEKSYNDITIQDIITRSNIARSTFYSTFKTKDDMLVFISKTLFEHIFDTSLTPEDTHDFSNYSLYDYKHLLTHIFYHLQYGKSVIRGILSSSSRNLFFNCLKNDFAKFAEIGLDNNFFKRKNLPKYLQINSLINNFILLMDYYDFVDYNVKPEQLTEYYIILNN